MTRTQTDPWRPDLESSEGGTSDGPNGGAEGPTRELPAAPATASEDRCGACGAPLAHDQRYCIECGERRGAWKASDRPARVAGAVASRSVGSRSTPPARVSSGTTLVAELVGVLLLAIGLGVLLGRLGHNNPAPQKAAAPEIVTVQGGGGGASTAATPRRQPHHARADPAATRAPKGLTGKLKAAAQYTAPPSKAVQQKATQAAGKVLGDSSHLAPPTIKVGGSCSSRQAGC